MSSIYTKKKSFLGKYGFMFFILTLVVGGIGAVAYTLVTTTTDPSQSMAAAKPAKNQNAADREVASKARVDAGGKPITKKEWANMKGESDDSSNNSSTNNNSQATAAPTAAPTTGGTGGGGENQYSFADLNQDGKVDVDDFSIFAEYYSTADLKADLNKDSKINISDFMKFREEYLSINN